MNSMENWMKVFKYLLLATICTSINTFAEICDSDAVDICNPTDQSNFERELEEKDWDALYDYINTKRTINVEEKASNLTISGDVRSDWRNIRERENHLNLRGGDALDKKGFLRGQNDFDIALNLRLDYVCKRAWVVAHLQFDNNAGICVNHCDSPIIDITEFVNGQEIIVGRVDALHGSGTGCDLDLKKAYFGYNLWCDGDTRLDIEIGRRRLYQIFESNVQFLSRFDGVFLKYDTSFDYADYYLHFGAFVVDYTCNHYAWVVETAFENIVNTGLDFKYSFINWEKNGKNFRQVRDPLGAQFLVSQFTVHYNLDKDWLCMPAQIFAAILVNHDAKNKVYYDILDEGLIALEGKKNLAWYAGFKIGEVVKANDWAFNVQYQWVQAFAIPDDDVSGIGNGNCLRHNLLLDHVGNTNFKGWRIEALYALTDNLSIDSRLEWSSWLDKVVSGDHSFSQFKVEIIYAF